MFLFIRKKKYIKELENDFIYVKKGDVLKKR